VPHVFIHFFGDGRDTKPSSGLGYMKDLLKAAKEVGCGDIATVVGRYYIMDRDKRWDRVEIGLKGVVLGEGEDTDDVCKTIQERYDKGEEDEFLKPIIVGGKERRIKGWSIFFKTSHMTLHVQDRTAANKH
jgi:2,3-bisphosphoglycerate-independent phosphoglycerate mutase